MRVDIWSDVVCPWCYVGKARFEKALAGFDGRDDVEVLYHSFELDPSWPSGQTMPIQEMMATKYQLSPADAEAAEGRVAALAGAEGLGFRSDRQLGNTFDLHRVLHLARAGGLQAQAIDAIYQANFADARQVFDSGVVIDVATEAGLDATEVAKVLGCDEYADAVWADEELARQLRITSVPFFALDMKTGISGAQSAETFTQALTQAWESTR
jgi:predicted DsbA family dithiol-disulfide isomerase